MHKTGWQPSWQLPIVSGCVLVILDKYPSLSKSSLRLQEPTNRITAHEKFTLQIIITYQRFFCEWVRGRVFGQNEEMMISKSRLYRLLRVTGFALLGMCGSTSSASALGVNLSRIGLNCVLCSVALQYINITPFHTIRAANLPIRNGLMRPTSEQAVRHHLLRISTPLSSCHT